MSCLDNIVTLGICPDDGENLSGFTLSGAAGINMKNLARITSGDQVSGADMALEVKKRTLLQVRNDFMKVLQMNGIVPSISNPVYPTSQFDVAASTGTYAGFRGLNLYKNKQYRGVLRKTTIQSVECYPLASGDTTLRIFDGIKQYSYPITVVANQVNVFDASQFDNFPFVMERDSARITIDQTDIPFAPTKITCMKGCNNTLPNPCGWADGWDGAGAVKSDGYGINVNFKCECDYERVICDLSKSFSGELIWLKWQYNIFDEQYKSNRFNNWVIYNREDLAENIMPGIMNAYNEKWNAMMEGLYSILTTYRDDCLICRGVRWKTNI